MPARGDKNFVARGMSVRWQDTRKVLRSYVHVVNTSIYMHKARVLIPKPCGFAGLFLAVIYALQLECRVEVHKVYCRDVWRDVWPVVLWVNKLTHLAGSSTPRLPYFGTVIPWSGIVFSCNKRRCLSFLRTAITKRTYTIWHTLHHNQTSMKAHLIIKRQNW
jgi:hypothetical protein